MNSISIRVYPGSDFLGKYPHSIKTSLKNSQKNVGYGCGTKASTIFYWPSSRSLTEWQSSFQDSGF